MDEMPNHAKAAADARLLVERYDDNLGKAYLAYAAERERLRQALEPFARYAEMRARQPLRGLGDGIHSIHMGSPHEAVITLTHCNVAREALSPSSPEGSK